MLHDEPRNLCLFTVGINVAFRANELIALDIDHVEHLKPGDVLDTKQRKTQTYRQVILNETAYNSIQIWLAVRPESESRALFVGQRGRLTTPSVHRLVKFWCKNVGLRGNYGSHSLRKTWGYMQRKYGKASETLISEAYGHASVKQTRAYLGIQSEEISNLYESMEL